MLKNIFLAPNNACKLLPAGEHTVLQLLEASFMFHS